MGERISASFCVCKHNSLGKATFPRNSLQTTVNGLKFNSFTFFCKEGRKTNLIIVYSDKSKLNIQQVTCYTCLWCNFKLEGVSLPVDSDFK